MKFAIYQPWIYLYGGLERSLLELVSRSRHQWQIFTNHYEPENTFPGFAKQDVTELRRVSVQRDLLSVFRAALVIGREKLPLDEVDGLVIWCDGLGDLMTFRNHEKPLFNICSTPMRPVFDPVYQRSARASRGVAGRLGLSFFATLFKAVDRRAWSFYDGVVSTSTEVRNRIIDGGLYPDCEQMIMAYPGIDYPQEFPEVSYEPFLLLPGRIMWTKNISLAVESFLAADLPSPWKLVVAGFVDEKSRPYLEELRQLAAGGAIEFVVSPDENLLRDLYRRCAFCLFPPLNEDWGIVPLEAMACGKPVLANASGGPAESIVDRQTGLLLEPTVASWSAAIRQLAGDENALLAMGRAAHRHVRQFSWEEFVTRIDNFLEEQAGKPK